MRLKVDVDEKKGKKKGQNNYKTSIIKNETFQKIRIHAHINQMLSVFQKW